MTRKEILATAEMIVCNNRDKKYGTPEDNFQKIAELWNAYLRHRSEIHAEDVAVMMILLKVARMDTGEPTADTWVDIAGYAACGAESMFAKE